MIAPFLALVTPPDGEELAITLEAIKEHLRVIGTTEDAQLTGYVKAATATIDGPGGWLGRALLTQTWKLNMMAFPASCDGNPSAAIYIPLPPLQEITSVKYVDSNGTLQTMDDEAYRVISDERNPAMVLPAWGTSWPSARPQPDGVQVEFACGYGDDATEAGAASSDFLTIQQYLKLLTGDYYENRETAVIGTSVADIPHFSTMLENLRVRGALYAGWKA